MAAACSRAFRTSSSLRHPRSIDRATVWRSTVTAGRGWNTDCFTHVADCCDCPFEHTPLLIIDANIDEWRRSFVGYNNGSVDVVGWRREREGGAELLSFWIAAGPDGHKACAYTTPRPSGFLDALSDRFGVPDNLDKNDVIESVTAGWKRGAVDYSFVQVGTSAVINISSSR